GFAAAVSSLEGRFGLLGDRAERGRVADGEVGEHLPVELDPGLRAAVYELVVREPVRAGSRVDPRDPELAELPLPHLPVAVRVDERVLDLLLRIAVVRALAAPVALCLLENLAALLLRVDGTLDARHLPHPIPSIFLIAPRSALVTSRSLRKPRLRFDDFFSRLWLRIAGRRRILPLPVTLNRFRAELRVFVFGISFHSCVLRRAEQHHHVASVLDGLGFDLPDLLDVVGEA